MAKALGLPIHLDPSEFIEKDITALRAELEENIAKLRQIQSSDSEIARLAEVAATSYAQAGDCLDRIEQLPKPPSDIELLGSSLLAGFATGDPIMGALAGASVGADSDSKKQAIIREMEQLARIHQKADVAHLGLARVARKYAGAPVDGAARISVDLNEAWGSFGPFDWLCLYNHGAAAKDCTIEVELTGADGSARKNVHFVAEWPADQWLYARYEPGFVLRDTRVLSQSVASVKSVTVRIISPEFSTVREYVYQGAEKDKDIAERLKSVSLDLKYQRFVKGLLWDTERGCYVAVRGGGFMECRVDVNFMKGGRRLNGWFWQFDSWQDGEEKSFLTNAGDLTSDPDEIVVTISFPGTVEKIQRTFRVF